MPTYTINSGDTTEILARDDHGKYFFRVTGEDVTISRTADRRYASGGVPYPRGFIGSIHSGTDTRVFATNEGSAQATVEIDTQLVEVVGFDPAASGTQTVTDDGNFNLAGNQDVDIAEQSLARLTSKLEVDNGSGTFGDVHRNGNDLQVSIEQDNATATRNVVVEDVNFSTSQTDALDVSAATVNVQEATALDVSGATVPTEQQTPVALEDDGGTAISTTNPLSVDLRADNLSGNLDVDIAETSAAPLDVSAATVTTDLSDDITRSAGTVRLENPSSLIAFQHTTSSTSAEALASNSVSPRGTVTVQADPDNTGDVFLGNGTNQPIQLSPGDSIGDINVDNTSDLSVNADTSGDSVNVVAS